MQHIEQLERDRDYRQALDEARRIAELINAFAEQLRVDDPVLRSNIITLYVQSLLMSGAED